MDVIILKPPEHSQLGIKPCTKFQFGSCHTTDFAMCIASYAYKSIGCLTSIGLTTCCVHAPL